MVYQHRPCGGTKIFAQLPLTSRPTSSRDTKARPRKAKRNSAWCPGDLCKSINSSVVSSHSQVDSSRNQPFQSFSGIRYHNLKWTKCTFSGIQIPKFSIKNRSLPSIHGTRWPRAHWAVHGREPGPTLAYHGHRGASLASFLVGG